MRACVPPRPCAHVCVCACVRACVCACSYACSFMWLCACRAFVPICLLAWSTFKCAYVQYTHMLSVCGYVCVIVHFGPFIAHIQMYMCVCVSLSVCVTDSTCGCGCVWVCVYVWKCVCVCVHVRVFETWGCVTSLYAQPLWLTPSPVAPYSGSLPVGTTQPVVEEGRWTEELGSSCQFSFSSWDVFVYYLKNL